MATNVSVNVIPILPQAGANSDGHKLGWINSASKAAQNDTLTLANGTLIQVLSAIVDSTGAFETHTVSGNVITCTSSTTSATISLMVLYK